jgi:hypothetical protein
LQSGSLVLTFRNNILPPYSVVNTSKSKAIPVTGREGP